MESKGHCTQLVCSATFLHGLRSQLPLSRSETLCTLSWWLQLGLPPIKFNHGASSFGVGGSSFETFSTHLSLTIIQQISGTFEISQGVRFAMHKAFVPKALCFTVPLIATLQMDDYSLVLQANRNKVMHSQHGNTTLKLYPQSGQIYGRAFLNLCQLIPPPTLSNYLTYDRQTLMSYKSIATTKDRSQPPLITTPIINLNKPKNPNRRSGLRLKIILPNGNIIYRKKKHNPSSRDRGIHRIQEYHNSLDSRTPPPRGAPGTHIVGYEECFPQMDRAIPLSRGSLRRRLRRRAYRQWKRQRKQERMKGPAPPHPALTKPKNAALTRAKWFRNTVYWQEDHTRRKGRKVRNFPTTTPLSYDSKIKFGSLNVQGMADTLKLRNAIQLMQEHRLGVLLLSETRSTSYYSYTSEQHLVIVSGNKSDRFAGVGAIISPWLRPYLMDVIQVSNRLIHLAFKKQGGNMHVIGVYGPHSGLDEEGVRVPFWDTLEEHIAKIPAPEPVYVAGDFNVRFQATQKVYRS